MWEGKVQTDSEVLLIIKTVEERIADLQVKIKEAHPHSVPEFIAMDIATGQGETRRRGRKREGGREQEEKECGSAEGRKMEQDEEWETRRESDFGSGLPDYMRWLQETCEDQEARPSSSSSLLLLLLLPPPHSSPLLPPPSSSLLDTSLARHFEQNFANNFAGLEEGVSPRRVLHGHFS
eukprot:348285-Hanusia_phi.AAC.5